MEPRSIYTRKPALGGRGGGGGGGGRKLGALVQTSIKRPPPLFFAELRCKKRGRIIEQVRYLYKIVHYGSEAKAIIIMVDLF